MTKPTEVTSPRLRLVPLTSELAALQIEEREAFFAALGVEFEASWPPELMSEHMMHWYRDKLTANPDKAGWYAWVYISPVMNRLVGVGGFYGPPASDGAVEIAYSMLLSYREQGLATEGVEALMNWAYAQPGVETISARTPLDREAAQRVLEKAGFVRGGTVEDSRTGETLVRWSHRQDRQAA